MLGHQKNLEALAEEDIALHIEEQVDLELGDTWLILEGEGDKGHMKEVQVVPKEQEAQCSSQEVHFQ